jgi:hypothetical protein
LEFRLTLDAKYNDRQRQGLPQGWYSVLISARTEADRNSKAEDIFFCRDLFFSLDCS